MPSFFLSFNVLRRQAQLKGWSNRPEVPLASSSGWRKKNLRPSPPTTALPSSNSKPTGSATSTTASTSIYGINSKPSLSPGRSNTASNWKGGATTNVLLIHPICRCCTDVVNCITRPYKRRASKASMHSTTTSTSTGRSCSGRKTEWDGLPSTHYMRLWPQPDHERLREARFMSSSPRSRFAPSNSCSATAGRPGSPSAGEKRTSGRNSSKKQKRRSFWKFWPSIF